MDDKEKFARLKAFGAAMVAAMETASGREVDFNLRMSIVGVLQNRPIRPREEPVVPWRDEDERRYRERFGWTLVEASRAYGVEIPSEVAFRMLVWLLTGPGTEAKP